GYTNYTLNQHGDPNSAVYSTANTRPNISALGPPDVFLNASVHVGEISLVVTNIAAKINLALQVRGLLTFNAGVTASIARVRLLIQEVDARVTLEARLENIVRMVDDVLSSIDLNPIIAELGRDVSSIVNNTVGILEKPPGAKGAKPSAAVGQAGGAARMHVPRSVYAEHGILYAVNDYSGRTHTNRVLGQDGRILDVELDNEGVVHSERAVGYYAVDMKLRRRDASGEGAEEQWVYVPLPGLEVVSTVVLDGQGRVVSTRVTSSAFGGGSSVIAED
ncbi:hypothetical protein EJ06DRAFT_456687, partial [Trichodelitschia bisporula]